ncbi:MAG: biotin--[acetyl-CoA-carboxylase] ligase [Bacteroidales bacterium]
MKNDLLHFIETTHSTNQLLSSIVQDHIISHTPLEEFYTLYTNFQTAGRGLSSNVWHSNKGENILVSFYFTPPLTPSNQFVFNQFFTLSIRKMLSQYIEPVMIKWPNDIYIHHKKIAGILIEHSVRNNTIQHTVAGVGININQTLFDSSLPNPTSLKLLTQQDFSVKKLIMELLETTQIYYDLVKSSRYATLQDDYLNHLYLREEYHSYQIKEEFKEAKIKGINHFGQLLLQDKKGCHYCCGLKEVRFL